MMTVEQFIDALGGTTSVANQLGIAPTTVSSWKTANSIPRWRMDGLRALAAEQGVEVPEVFAEPEPASERSAAA